MPAPAISTDLAMVAEIGAVLTSTSLADLLATLHRHLKWLLPATTISLCLVEDDGVQYRRLTQDGGSIRYPLTEGLIGWVLRSRTVLDIPDLQAQARPPGCSHLPPYGEGAQLILPLQVEGQFLGALTIGSPRVGAYRAVDRGIVNLIVAQVAAAVRIALLVAELDDAEAIIAGMARAVEAKDPYTHGHAARVTTYALQLATAVGVQPHIHDLLVRAGPLHDVGKIGVPDHVLSKPGHLTDDEVLLVRRHVEIGEEICRPLRSLRRLLPGIRHHHERYDGLGYPDGVAGQAIPLEARVLAIADAYDAMTSDRPYRAGMPPARAIAIIAANDGPQWDPDLASPFAALPLVSLAPRMAERS